MSVGFLFWNILFHNKKITRFNYETGQSIIKIITLIKSQVPY